MMMMIITTAAPNVPRSVSSYPQQIKQQLKELMGRPKIVAVNEVESNSL
jgi:hypothetical protein